MIRIACLLILCGSCLQGAAGEMLAPQIDGEWWQVAGDPECIRPTLDRAERLR